MRTKDRTRNVNWVKWTAIFTGIAVLVSAPITVIISVATESNTERRHQEERDNSLIKESESLDTQAFNVVVDLSRYATDGIQPVKIRNNSDYSMTEVQVLYVSTLHQNPLTGIEGTSETNLPSFEIDPLIAQEVCIDSHTWQVIIRTDAVDPGKDLSIPIPASSSLNYGDDVRVQFREATNRGQWWEAQPGVTPKKINAPLRDQEGIICHEGGVSLNR